ncbi:MAG: hypothetical protein ABIC04_05655 [Nanoarchaeota archaeon]
MESENYTKCEIYVGNKILSINSRSHVLGCVLTGSAMDYAAKDLLIRYGSEKARYLDNMAENGLLFSKLLVAYHAGIQEEVDELTQKVREYEPVGLVIPPFVKELKTADLMKKLQLQNPIDVMDAFNDLFFYERQHVGLDLRGKSATKGLDTSLDHELLPVYKKHNEKILTELTEYADRISPEFLDKVLTGDEAYPYALIKIEQSLTQSFYSRENIITALDCTFDMSQF